MSTILQALQKNKLEQVGSQIPIMASQPTLPIWKIAVSMALVIIIALLSTLIYLQLNPVAEVTHPVALTPPVTPPITKIEFVTQPLMPLPVAPTQRAIIPAETLEIKTSINNIALAPPVISPITQPPQSQVTEPSLATSDEIQPLDYDEVPDELKKRFEQALLLTDLEDEQTQDQDSEQAEEDRNDDGSDIHQMSSAFQRNVAPISYDSHVYSTRSEERWIRINGEILKEGEFDSSGELQLIEIQPQRSIFRVQRQSFSLGSLTDWLGY